MALLTGAGFPAGHRQTLFSSLPFPVYTLQTGDISCKERWYKVTYTWEKVFSTLRSSHIFPRATLLLGRTETKPWASLCRWQPQDPRWKFWLQQIVVGPVGKMNFIPLLWLLYREQCFSKFLESQLTDQPPNNKACDWKCCTGRMVLPKSCEQLPVAFGLSQNRKIRSKSPVRCLRAPPDPNILLFHPMIDFIFTFLSFLEIFKNMY